MDEATLRLLIEGEGARPGGPPGAFDAAPEKTGRASRAVDDIVSVLDRFKGAAYGWVSALSDFFARLLGSERMPFGKQPYLAEPAGLQQRSPVSPQFTVPSGVPEAQALQPATVPRFNTSAPNAVSANLGMSPNRAIPGMANVQSSFQPPTTKQLSLPGMLGPMSGAEGAAMTGTVIGAVVMALVKVIEAALSAAKSLSNFSASMISADESAAATVQATSDMNREFTAAIPPLKYAGEMVSIFGDWLAKTMGQFDQMVDRYSGYSPAIAQAEALGEIRQTLGDLRRSQEVAGPLVQYIQARTELQQKIEDMKVRLLTQMAPTLIRGMAAFERLLPLIEGIAGANTVILETVLNLLGVEQQSASTLDDTYNYIREMTERPDEMFPTSIVMAGVFPFSTRAEGGRSNPGAP